MNLRDARKYEHSTDPAVAAEARRTIAASRARKARVRPKRAAGVARKAAKRVSKSAHRAEVRAACVARSRGHCEACGVFRGGAALHMDHFWGRGREESVESCWMLCPACDDDKTNNRPTRCAWLGGFTLHLERQIAAGTPGLYRGQLAKADNAIVLEAAQHPDHRKETKPCPF